MSLTSHLKDSASPIGQFLRTRFANTSAISLEANSQLKNFESILPSSRHSYPYGTVGMAIDYRLRYYFAASPVDDLVAYEGAARLIERMDSFDGTLMQSFFDDLSRTIEAMKPVGRLLNTASEALLTRYCFVLALFEEVYRSGVVPDLLVTPTPRQDVPGLLAVADDAWIEELCRMSSLFYERCRHLLVKPFILNPTFSGSADVGGADADLVVDGCLLEVKTSINAKLDPQWLRQLAGYVLLDYEDAHSIRSVGFYMVRQGALLRWPLDDFFRTLTGDPSISVADLRSEFHALCTAPRPRAEVITGGRSRQMPTELIEQASQDEKCVLCGTALVCTFEENVEREGPRGRKRRVDLFTVRCTTCDAQTWAEYPPSSLPLTTKRAQKQRAELIHAFNHMGAIDHWLMAKG